MREFTVEQARKYADLTQQQVADEMNMCRSTYINLEKNPDLFTIHQAKRFAEITGIPLDVISFVCNKQNIFLHAGST